MVMLNKGSQPELDPLIKQVTSATVKFSNDKILKASGFLRDGATFYKRSGREEEFRRLMDAWETLKNDRSSLPFINQIEAIGAILPAFATNLLANTGTSPLEHLKSCKESSQFYLNRILKTAKENNDEQNIEWVHAMNLLMDGLLALGTGGTVSSTKLEREDEPTSTITKTASFAVTRDPSSASAETMSTLASKGTTVATTTKATTATTTVNTTNNITPSSDTSPTLEGDRWYLRRCNNLSDPVIITPEGHHQAVVLEDCKGIATRVVGKVKGVTIDHGKSVDAELTGDVISNVEVLASSKVRLFLVGGRVPTVVLDECEDVQIYVGEASKEIKIITSKCCQVNVLMPAGVIKPELEGEEEADEWIEMALPAQFISHLGSNGKMITEPASHIGA